jgi:hypothetical protein
MGNVKTANGSTKGPPPEGVDLQSSLSYDEERLCD